MKTISTGLNGPTGLAFDAAGNLFVANLGGSTVTKYAPGSSTPVTISTGIDQPQALQILP